MVQNRRAQAAPASSLIILIAVFVVLYILLLPPDARNALLNDDPNGKDPSLDQPGILDFNTTILEVSPGRIDYLKFKEYSHPLPSVNLYSTTTAIEQEIANSVYVKNGIFDKKISNVTFMIDEPENINSVYLTFDLSQFRKNKGNLKIFLNDKLIFNKVVRDQLSEPILIKDNLERRNKLTFEVDGVGYKFWTTNEYELDDLKIFFDATDVSTQNSKNTFMVTESEKYNLELSKVKFSPDCSPRTVGRLNVYVNKILVFSSVPDCGILNLVEISSSVIEAGTNQVIFESDKGNYLIDHIEVVNELQSMTYPTYYFDLPAKLFSETIEEDINNEAECGEIDGECPRGCDADVDKDCCLLTTSNYWCDYQPYSLDDRCRAVSTQDHCSLCASGYEDNRGYPPDECEDLCGDDTDRDCPSGCSRYYDKDCCFEDDDENFWCDDIPKFGLATCKDAITNDECDACYADWESDESNFRCEESTSVTDAILKTKYDVQLTLKFTDDYEKKAGKIFINGYQFHFFTYKDEYSRNINNYIEDSTNSIKIEPDQTVLDIRSLTVKVDD
jgi:hypothetical protein